MKPAIFLDRDNTIIHNDGDLGDPDQVRLIQGASSAIASLCGLGYRIVVITNQGGVARGKYGEDDVARVHDRLHDMIVHAANGARIDAFYYCPYHPEGTVRRYTQEHPWRKPQPGMLFQAAEDHSIDLSRSWTIGDQLRDVEAGKAAGTRTILLNADGRAPGEDVPDAQQPDFVVRNLVEAVRIVAQKRHQSELSQDTARRSAEAPGRDKWNAAAVARLQQSSKPIAPEKADAPSDSANDHAGKAEADPPAPPEDKARPVLFEDKPKVATPPSPAPAGDTQVKPTAPKPAGPRRAAPEPVEPKPPSPPPAPAPSPPTSTSPATAKRHVVEDDEPASLGTSKVPAETTLRQILHELRHQRGEGQTFSYPIVLAIILQMVAGVCLLGGLWMGAGDNDLFQRWIAAALIFQGATIATLLFPR
ncbi:HAD-IIIA family hydrolase [Phycisphaerales bacterium AB-hyl4]|uniref:D,D-heptose 1,7-bisphosphate phosphatase n=1 Tax=Natronomicrosphaera hydrolytica TaxID=3242702 RepID=A0ABV4U140_9BACT